MQTFKFQIPKLEKYLQKHEISVPDGRFLCKFLGEGWKKSDFRRHFCTIVFIRHQAKCFDEREGGGGKDKERRGREEKEKKGTKADGKVWRPSPSYRPPNYFRLVNAIFLKARTICIKAYICVTFKNTFK